MARMHRVHNGVITCATWSMRTAAHSCCACTGLSWTRSAARSKCKASAGEAGWWVGWWVGCRAHILARCGVLQGGARAAPWQGSGCGAAPTICQQHRGSQQQGGGTRCGCTPRSSHCHQQCPKQVSTCLWVPNVWQCMLLCFCCRSLSIRRDG
jgi:hypothetical protein